ncbi:hypothetical protein VP01_3762g2 [Puccinia sorghi]|uniref:Uncharacterized protein n=1 Tax=Puccinia sorghi TaxID=27349 RepID=A0A0L6UTR5_9BASI|nr:hypothetical protein VP01_3762g2 [Puccinia sorghi]
MSRRAYKEDRFLPPIDSFPSSFQCFSLPPSLSPNLFPTFKDMSTPVEIPNPNITQPPKQPKVFVQDGVRYYPLRDEWSPAWINTQLPANLASPKSEGLESTTEYMPVPPSFTNFKRRNLPSASSHNRASSLGAAPPPTPVPSVNYLKFDLEAVQQVLVADNPTPFASHIVLVLVSLKCSN